MLRLISICILFLLCIGLLPMQAGAQTTADSTRIINRPDSTLAKADTLKNKATAADTQLVAKMKKGRFEPKPKKAGLYSAILPGSGQFYNRQYWKPPVIYAGMVAAGYFFNFNMEKYHTYRKAYFGRLTNGGNITADETEEIKRYTTENLKTLQDEYRKYLDMTVLISALGYTIQVIDAIASAHLKNFDMSRDISLQFKAVAEPNYIGFGVAMNFK